MEQPQNDPPNSSIPTAIIIGALMISLSILISGGVVQFKNGKISLSAAREGGQATGLSGSPSVVSPDAAKPQTPPTKTDATLGHLPIKGDANAKIAVVEFGDMRCPFCKRFFDDTQPQLINNYVNTGKIKFAFRHFEFLGSASVTAGNAVECANEQGKFWEYGDYLYKNQPDESDTSMYTSDKLTNIAANLGLNSNQFKSCLDSTKYSKNLTDDQNEGQRAGVTGTPAFIVGKLDQTGNKITNGQLIVGAQPYSAFQSAIDTALK